jgi:hypothetical protein
MTKFPGKAPSIAPETAHLLPGPEDDLRAENVRLRRLVADLLLENIRLEQELKGRRDD